MTVDDSLWRARYFIMTCVALGRVLHCVTLCYIGTCVALGRVTCLYCIVTGDVVRQPSGDETGKARGELDQIERRKNQIKRRKTKCGRISL